MREVIDFFKANDANFLLALSALGLVLLICFATVSRKLGRLNRRRSAKLEEGRVGDIVDCLADQSDALSRVQEQLAEIQTMQSRQGQDLQRCLTNVGVVRFNAFDDVGGEQSFAVVLLDSDRNGVAFSSLYGRQDSRVYAKAISNGQGERTLSNEEQQALAKALK
jgi:hypothetical protein